MTRLAVLVLLATACGGQTSDPDNGGRTHWLSACTQDSECGEGLCFEQRCTSECSAQADCLRLSAEAVCSSGVDSTAFTLGCALSPGQDVCLPSCDSDSDCDAIGRVCASGVCVPVDCVPQQPSAVPSDTAAAPSSLDASESDAGVTPTFTSNPPDAAPAVDTPGIRLSASLDGAAPQQLEFGQEVAAYTRDPDNRTLVSIVATSPEWGSLTLNVVRNPGPVTAGEYACATGSSFVSATMLTDTGILSFSSDNPPLGTCNISVLEPGEQVGAPFAGNFDATLATSAGTILTITDGVFWGALNE